MACQLRRAVVPSILQTYASQYWQIGWLPWTRGGFVLCGKCTISAATLLQTAKILPEPVTSFRDMHEANASADFVTSDGLVIGFGELAMRYQFS